MRKLMWFAIGFIASCAVIVYLFAGSAALVPALLVLVAAIVLCFFRKRSTGIIAAVLFGIFTGTVWLYAYDALYLQIARQYDGESITATIEISDYSTESLNGLCADGTIMLDDQRFQVRAYLNDAQELLPGDELTGEFELRFTGVGGKKEVNHHSGKGIFLFAYQKDEIDITHTDDFSWKYFPSKLRKQILHILDEMFPEDTQAFARALLLGDSSKLTYQDDTGFKVSGIRHIIAVSGLHVAILFALIYGLCAHHRVLTAVFGLPVLLLFAAVAGFTPSVSRACVMQALMILAILLNKEYDPPTSLAFAVLVILMANPMAITSVSLQLSAGCILGIFIFSKRLNAFLTQKMGVSKGMSRKAKLLRGLCGSVSVTLSAMIATTPLCAYYFGMVSIVGVIANILSLWVVSFVFYGIILSCVLGAIWLPLGSVVAMLTSWPMRYILALSNALSSFPMAAVYTSSIYVVIWLVFVYVLFAVFLLLKRRHPLSLCLCVVVGLVVALTASVIEPKLDNYRVTVLDVGQGQSILLQTDHTCYLVDCGGENAENAADVAAAQLLSQGITKLDGLILTHYDQDHAGGVPYLLTRISVETVYLPDIKDDTNMRQTLNDLCEDKICLISRRMVLENSWGKLTLYPGSEGQNENESSMCVLFQPQECDILITGDRDRTGEKALIKDTTLPELELLVVGHHGSKTATSLELLKQTNPKTAIISVGKKNRYGHPSDEVLDRLESFGCVVCRTDIQGTIIFRG